MYYKIINDRMVFSTCKTLQLEDGTWVSNPSEETIFANGWQVYVPVCITCKRRVAHRLIHNYKGL